ncbi:hypothetical protein [Streptomyces decoyicus]
MVLEEEELQLPGLSDAAPLPLRLNHRRGLHVVDRDRSEDQEPALLPDELGALLSGYWHIDIVLAQLPAARLLVPPVGTALPGRFAGRPARYPPDLTPAPALTMLRSPGMGNALFQGSGLAVSAVSQEWGERVWA